MEPVNLSEVLDIAQYEKARPRFRARVLEIKERRRLGVGPAFTFLFENRITVLYQIQEMLRIERIVEDKAIAHEVETYNELIPKFGGLGATLLIEYTDAEERTLRLAELVGIERHVRLLLGELPPLQGEFDTRQVDSERVSAVQYILFPLEEAHRAAWGELGASGGIRLSIDHPRYRHETVLPPRVVAALGEDFTPGGASA